MPEFPLLIMQQHLQEGLVNMAENEDFVDEFLKIFRNQNKNRLMKQRQIYKAGKDLIIKENKEETKDNE